MFLIKLLAVIIAAVVAPAGRPRRGEKAWWPRAGLPLTQSSFLCVALSLGWFVGESEPLAKVGMAGLGGQ